jgi:hypothetical protein
MENRKAVQGSDRVFRYQFDSISDAVESALSNFGATEENAIRVTNEIDSSLTGRCSWANYYSKESFMNCLKESPKRLVDAVEEMKNEILSDVADFVGYQPRRKVKRGQEFGDEICSDRFLSRIPNVWERSVKVMMPKKTVRIGANLSVNCNVGAEQLIYRGAAALALADILNSKGFNVEIASYFTIRHLTNKAEWFTSKIVLKNSSMPLNVGSLAFVMCDIAFPRIVMALGSARLLDGTIDGGFGYAAGLTTADRNECDYIIDANVLSKEAAINWIKTSVNKKESEAA